MSYLHKLIVVGILFISQAPAVQSQETRIVDFSADLILYDERTDKEIQRLLGNVTMKHKNLQLTCDSAYLDQSKNHFIGFSRVHIIKADTIHIYSNRIDYNGKEERARLDGRVLMINDRISVKAPVMDYNMKEEIAWYYGGGQIIDTTNTVESFWGYFYVDRNEFFFKENVILSNDESTLVTDTLRYHSDTEEMWFNGLTQIYGDTNYITCHKGYYDSHASFSRFEEKVFMQSRQQLLRGDSIAYFRETGQTEVFYNVQMQDTVEQMTVHGSHLSYNEKEDWFRMVEDVLYILADSKDTLFMHSDTLYSYRDDQAKSRHIETYPQVQFYRNDLQGRCNFLDYVVSDSLIKMYDQPVIWQESSQLTADSIQIRLKEGGIHHMTMFGSGFLITREGEGLFNQIKGKKIVGWFSNDELSWVDVTGNGESLFYPKDDEDIIGLNHAVCSNIHLYFKEGKIDRIALISDPDPRLIPMKDATEKDKYLEGFRWLEEFRPQNSQDIRLWKK